MTLSHITSKTSNKKERQHQKLKVKFKLVSNPIIIYH